MRAQTTNTVIVDEWPAMAHGGASPLADRQVEKLADDLRHLPVRSPAEASMQGRILTAIDQGLAERDERLIMDSVGLDGVMWWTLSLGACITIGFATLFGFKRVAMRSIMIGALAATIGLVLYLAISLDYPYRGVVSVSSEAFHNAIASYDHIDEYH